MFRISQPVVLGSIYVIRDRDKQFDDETPDRIVRFVRLFLTSSAHGAPPATRLRMWLSLVGAGPRALRAPIAPAKGSLFCRLSIPSPLSKYVADTSNGTNQRWLIGIRFDLSAQATDEDVGPIALVIGVACAGALDEDIPGDDRVRVSHQALEESHLRRSEEDRPTRGGPELQFPEVEACIPNLDQRAALIVRNPPVATCRGSNTRQ